jgi:hypothetical protein
MVMKATTETLTAKKAAALLAASDEAGANIRKRTDGYVARLARSMSEGRWEENGETIKISSDGTILDGQHRLAACVLANKSFKTIVVRGVPSVIHVDMGMKRSAASILKQQYEGFGNPAVTAALARLLLIERGAGSVISRGNNVWAPDNQEILSLIEEDTELMAAASDRGMSVKHLLRPANAAYIHYKASKAGYPEMADEFLKALSLTDFETGSVMQKIFNRLLKSRMKSGRGAAKGGQMSRTTELAFIIKAWNWWFRGENPTKLYLNPPKFWTQETFPKMYLG